LYDNIILVRGDVNGSPIGFCQGPHFAKAIAKVLPHLDVEIVKRSDRLSGFGLAHALDPRLRGDPALHRLVQSLPKARQGLGV
jgi:hypothetical protein